jgi:hypothetical protein
MAGIRNSARLPVHLKSTIETPIATVTETRTNSAERAVVTFSSLVMNKMKKGMRSWNGSLNVFATKTIAVQTTASRSAT